MIPINKSFVPREAVIRTIRIAVAMWEKIHGPAKRADIEKIERETIRQANIINMQGAIKDDESIVGSHLYPGGRRV